MKQPMTRKNLFGKSRHAIKKHFIIERLQERYNIKLTIRAYDNLTVKNATFLYSKSDRKKLYAISINGVIVPVLYEAEEDLFSTAYPPDVLTDEISFLRACFGSKIHSVVFMIHGYILDSIKNQYKDFETDKEAALYFFQQCEFPTLLISIRKYGKYEFPQIARQIDDIINFQGKSCRLIIQPFTLDEKKKMIENRISRLEETGNNGTTLKRTKASLKTLTYSND